jgi:PAS domain S-box-containing protein
MEKPLRILIVEDNTSDVEIVKRLLSKGGFHFTDKVVESKEEFISAMIGFEPDLILCDYSMPRFDGMRALLIRKEMAPFTPFVLVTGSVNEEVAVECMKAGADDYVLKQNLIRLIPAVRAALEKQQTIRMRQEAEAALRISEERFKQIAEVAGEFIWEVDSTGLYTYVNKISEGILGYSSNEIVGKKHFYDFFVPELAETLKSAAFQAFAEKTGFKRFENANTHKDGHIVILSTTGMPVLDAEGNLLGYRGVDTDITEQKKAELALRESEERFRNLYSNMAEGVCLQKLVFDHHGKAVDYEIIGVNQQYENILGTKKEDVVGKLASEVYNISPPPYLQEYASVVNSGSPFSFESFFQPMNKHFSISVSPWDKDGFATIFADITHRVMAEEGLRQERMMLRTMIDHIPDSIFVKDAQGRKVIANPADLRIMQLTSEAEAIGKTDIELYPGESGQEWYNEDMAVLSTGQPILNQEGYYIDEKGNKRWQVASKIPLKDEAGNIIGLVGIGHDITNQRQAEEEIRQKVKELALSNDELTRFNRLAIGREMRMIELKQHCNRLATQLGLAEPYNLDFLKQDISQMHDNKIASIPIKNTNLKTDLESD